jgi:hypothetical protein
MQINNLHLKLGVILDRNLKTQFDPKESTLTMATSITAPRPLMSPHPITTQYAGLSSELILTKAKARVANHITNTPDANGLDPFLMVVEDEFGDLVHTRAIFLSSCRPHQFCASGSARQLNTEIKGEYDRRQLAVWLEVLRDGEQFQVRPN